MHTNKKSEHQLRDELNRITALQRQWNALNLAERVSVAKSSPDLSAFFRRDIESRNDRVTRARVVPAQVR